MRILLTGATGSFGRELARELLLHDCEVFAVVRGESALGARERLRTIVGASPKLHAVHGDIALGIPRIPDVDAVLHGAASTAFGLPLAEARRTNVEATRNVLELASAVPGLTKLGYISTAFVAGRRTGRILESELQHDAGFVNSYEQSKYEAELLVRASDLPLPVSIFRPSVVVDRDERSRSALRFVLDLVRTGVLPVLPGEGDDRFDIIDGADAARAVVEIFLGAAGGIYHVASGEDAPLLADIVGTAGAVRFVNGTFTQELAALRRQQPSAGPIYDRLETFIDVLRCPKIFDTTEAEAMLGCSVQLADPVEAVAA